MLRSQQIGGQAAITTAQARKSDVIMASAYPGAAALRVAVIFTAIVAAIMAVLLEWQTRVVMLAGVRVLRAQVALLCAPISVAVSHGTGMIQQPVRLLPH